MMEENEDQQDLLLFGSVDPDHFASQAWDCPGCPPPYFDLPPPPRPDFLSGPDNCNRGGNNENKESFFASPYEFCDNPIIIDSHLLRQNDLLNILLVVISAVAVVLFILLMACIIWRKRRGTLSHFSFRKSSAHSSPDSTVNQPHQKCDFEFVTPTVGFPQPQRFQSSLCNKNGDAMELNDNPSARHVYSNPNYPTLEIGGLPFFLMPSSSSSPSDKDTSLTNQVMPKMANQNPNAAGGFYHPEHEYVSSSTSQRSGPIYEDIDRMCTYKGAPPGLGEPKIIVDRNYYCNVMPPAQQVLPPPPIAGEKSRFSRPESGSSSSPHPRDNLNNCGTSSSEVSFESGSSPRHPTATTAPASSNNTPHHVIVNPRFRTFSPTSLSSSVTSNRSPNSSAFRVANNSNAKPSSPSVYYYSDTLRPKQNRGFVVDSDSGISSQTHDTPPPRQLQQQQQQQQPLPPLPSARTSLRKASAGRAPPLPLSPRELSGEVNDEVGASSTSFSGNNKKRKTKKWTTGQESPMSFPNAPGDSSKNRAKNV